MIGLDWYESILLYIHKLDLKQLATWPLEDIVSEDRDEFMEAYDEKESIVQGVIGLGRDELVIMWRVQMDLLDAHYFDPAKITEEEEKEDQKEAEARYDSVIESMDRDDVVLLIIQMLKKIKDSRSQEINKIETELNQLKNKIDDDENDTESVKRVIEIFRYELVFKSIQGIGRVTRTEYGLKFKFVADSLTRSVRNNRILTENGYDLYEFRCGGGIWIDRHFHTVHVDDLMMYWKFLEEEPSEERKKPLYNIMFDVIAFHDKGRIIKAQPDNVKHVASMSDSAAGNHKIEWKVWDVEDTDGSSDYVIVELESSGGLFDGMDNAFYQYIENEKFVNWVKHQELTFYCGIDEDIKLDIMNTMENENKFMLNKYESIIDQLQDVIRKPDGQLRGLLNGIINKHYQ